MNKFSSFLVTILLTMISSWALANEARYDPVCEAAAGRGAVQVADNTYYDKEKSVLILEFKDYDTVTLVGGVDFNQEVLQMILDEISRGFTPVGAMIMSGGELLPDIYLPYEVNPDGSTYSCTATIIRQ